MPAYFLLLTSSNNLLNSEECLHKINIIKKIRLSRFEAAGFYAYYMIFRFGIFSYGRRKNNSDCASNEYVLYSMSKCLLNDYVKQKKSSVYLAVLRKVRGGLV